MISEILDCRTEKKKRKRDTLQRFFWSFRNFRTSFPLWEYTLRIYLQSSPVVRCRLYSCNSNERELHYIFFSGKFSVQLFQSTLIKSSVMKFGRVLDCTPYSCFISKNDSTRDNSLKFLEVKLSPLKNLWWIPILVAT